MPRLLFLLGFVLISCVLPVQAADVSGDALSNNAPDSDDVFSRASMRVQADYAEFDSQKDEAIYSGNVEITRDDLVIFGDQAIVNNSVDQSGNQKIKITGSPVRLKLKDKQGELISGKALIVFYDQVTNLIELRQKAFLQQKHRELYGDYINYNSDTEHVLAKTIKDASVKSDGRVNLVIYPAVGTPPKGDNKGNKN